MLPAEAVKLKYKVTTQLTQTIILIIILLDGDLANVIVSLYVTKLPGDPRLLCSLT